MTALDARAQITAGLGGEGVRADAERRQARAAVDFCRSPVLDRMRAQLEADPAAFDREHGAAGRISVGLYLSHAQRAGIDLDAAEEGQA